MAGLKTKRLPCVNNDSNKLYFKGITVNPDKSMVIYNKLQIISVTGKENKVIVTRLSTVYYWNNKTCSDYYITKIKTMINGYM